MGQLLAAGFDGAEEKSSTDVKEAELRCARACFFCKKKDTDELQLVDFVLRLSKWQKSNLHIILQRFSTGYFF